MADIQSDYKSKLKAVAPLTDYVTAAQGQIYVGGILLDECYDIYYSYREMKEPIYGYKSKHFDAMLPGTVIIHGQFTINYKHDAYLKTLLAKYREDTKGAPENALARYADRKASIDKAAKNYKSKLLSIQTLRSKIEDLDRQIDLAKQTHEAKLIASKNLELNKQQVAATHDTAITNAQLTNLQYIESLSPEDQADGALALIDFDAATDRLLQTKQNGEDYLNAQYAILNNINVQISQLEEIISAADTGPSVDALINELNSLYDSKAETENVISSMSLQHIANMDGSVKLLKSTVEPQGLFGTDTHRRDMLSGREAVRELQLQKEASLKVINDQVSIAGKETEDAWQKIEDLTNEKNQIDVATKNAIQELKTLKAASFDVNEELAKALSKQNNNSLPEDRVEDEPAFDILIYYGGGDSSKLHKALMGCHLTGHTHQIGQGGTPIQEVYQFVARELK